MKASFLLLASFPLISLASPAYQLHEWGTFTTVAGSDGVLLSGLQREEEQLPAFVHSHFGFENGQAPSVAKLTSVRQAQGYPAFPSRGKGLGKRPVSGVTVKMETPVIYFHSPEAFRAKVSVGFDGGTISQWYPARSGGETLPEPPPSVDPQLIPVPIEQWRIDSLKTGLAACGLLESEADAMVQTWWTSYFETEGLRIFWVLPTATTDRILPLTVTPSPEKIVRVLVGRSEVLRPRQEASWLASSRLTGDHAMSWNYTVDNDRFGLAIEERVKALESVATLSAVSGH